MRAWVLLAALVALQVFLIGSPAVACPAQGCVQIQAQPPGDGTYYSVVAAGSVADITFGAITTSGTGRIVEADITMPPGVPEEGQAVQFRVRLKRYSPSWTYQGTLEDKTIFEVFGGQVCPGFQTLCTGFVWDCSNTCTGPDFYCPSMNRCVARGGTCFGNLVTPAQCSCNLDETDPCPPDSRHRAYMGASCPSGSVCIVEVSAFPTM